MDTGERVFSLRGQTRPSIAWGRSRSCCIAHATDFAACPWPGRRQLELSLLTNPHVGMSQQRGELVVRVLLHPFSEQPLDLLDRRVIPPRRVEHAIDPPLVGLFPALDPIGIVESPVGTEVGVGGQRVPHELVRIDQLERAPLGLTAKLRMPLAAGTAKIDEKEMVLVPIGQKLTPGLYVKPDGPSARLATGGTRYVARRPAAGATSSPRSTGPGCTATP